jgi:hypothetical protein
MPAVQLSQLKAKISEISASFPRPQEFYRSLKDLFETYADHVYHPGQMVQTSRHIPSYHVQRLVMNQLHIDLARLCLEFPGAVLLNADLLWQDDFLEPRQIAAFLIGQAPLDPPESIIERIRTWSLFAKDRPSTTAVLNMGSHRLRAEAPNLLFDLINDWFASNKTLHQELAFLCMLAIIDDREYDNFPPIYQILGPWIQSPPIPLQNELVAVIEALAKRNPSETSYFLRKSLSTNPRPATARLIRQALPAFDPSNQEKLRTSLNEMTL